LPDVHFNGLLQQWPAKRNVRFLQIRWLDVAENTIVRHVLFDECRGIQQVNTSTRQFFRNGCKDRRVPAIVSKSTIPEQGGSDVRDFPDKPERVVHAGLGDPTDHDGFGGAPSSQCPKPLTHSVETDRSVSITVCSKHGIRMTAKGDTHDLTASLSHAFGDDDRKSALTCNQSDGSLALHVSIV